MSKIGIRSFLAIFVGKVVYTLNSKILKGGTTFPGRVSTKIKKDILKTITKNYKIILITGTNGKTTTTSMAYNTFLEDNKIKVITNGSGANLISGITTTFIKNYKFMSNEKRLALIEIDEANLKLFTKYVSPDIIAITNLFRDQLDRFGEVYTTLNIILDGIKLAPKSKLILNGDESLLGDLNLPNESVYYGFRNEINTNNKVELNADAKFCKKCGGSYSYKFITYNHLGSYYCENCNFKQPELKYGVDSIVNITADSSDVIINGTEYLINQPGTYNVYNALCSLSIARECNVSTEICRKSLAEIKSAFGRQETIDIGGKKVKMILVKNPAGYNEALNTLTLEDEEISASFLLNDNYADGTDVSWIWDVNFEMINDLNLVSTLVGGDRLYDMAIRLKTAGLDENSFIICDDFEKLLDSITNCKTEKVYLLCTYTAMVKFRKLLLEKNIIKSVW